MSAGAASGSISAATGQAMDRRAEGLLIEAAAAVATLAGGLRRGAEQRDAAVLSGGGLFVAVWRGRILAAGLQIDVYRQIEEQGLSLDSFDRLNARGGLVTPGLVDAHTHLLFAATREVEWQMRARGAGYLEILAAGGGILSTVAATRAASDDELLAGGRARLDQMLANGTTTVEAKSGYALDVAGELRLLELTDRLDREGPIELVPTFLGAHAVPAEFRARPDGTEAYVASVIGEQLPAVARQGIARSCDVFCERGVFDAAQSRRILAAAAEAGLAVRLHADELGPSGGAELAGELAAGPAAEFGGEVGRDLAARPAAGRCLSADHLAAPSDAGVAALARAAEAGNPVVATLLPATSWFLGKHHFAPARRFVDAGIPVALATDLNPGTSPTLSLPLAMSIACLEMGLTPVEALVGVTMNAACALGLGSEIGSIEPGKQADLVVWDVPTVEQLPYWLGGRLPRSVVKRGRLVFERG
ncbi:MAG TPA: amidohydrolase family protein [Candidatus Limnocylindrales bacterium]